MPTPISLPITCRCEKEHTFDAPFLVEGAGSTRVQVRCPHSACPAKNPLLSPTIPYTLAKDETVLKGDKTLPPKP